MAMFWMQRRDFLKLVLPLAALLVGCRPSPSVDCLSNTAKWLEQLKAFADPLLGKAAALALPQEEQKLPVPGPVCGEDFAERFRRQAAADFAAGNTITLDGWVVSKTEAFIHRAVYLADVPPAAGSGP